MQTVEKLFPGKTLGIFTLEIFPVAILFMFNEVEGIFEK
jgi:hypothetical protein